MINPNDFKDEEEKQFLLELEEFCFRWGHVLSVQDIIECLHLLGLNLVIKEKQDDGDK